MGMHAVRARVLLGVGAALFLGAELSCGGAGKDRHRAIDDGGVEGHTDAVVDSATADGHLMCRPDAANVDAVGCTRIVTSWVQGPDVGSATLTDCGEVFQCWKTGEPLPPMDKSCQMDADCFVASIYTGCCGSVVKVGLNVRERDPQANGFTIAARACSQPTCTTCASGIPEADDGRQEWAGEPIDVACCGGLCRTFVAGPDL